MSDAAANAAADSAYDVTVLAVFGPDSPHDLRGLAEDLQAQEGARAEVIFIDMTDRGLDTRDLGDGVRVLAPGTLSEGAALQAGLAAASADVIALRTPGSRSNPTWLAQAIAALAEHPDAAAITTNYFLSRADGQMAFNIDPSRDGEAPPPGWDAALVLRRRALERISVLAFLPVRLELYRTLLAEGAVHHVSDALYSVSADRFAVERFTAQWAHHCLMARGEEFEAPEPWLSVVVESLGDRSRLRRLMDGLVRQVLPSGTFEIVVADRGTGALAAELTALDWGLDVQAIHTAEPDAGAALNAAVALTRGTVVVFIDEGLTAFPDLLEQHIRGHRAHDPRELAVVGTTEVAALDLRRVLPQVLSDGAVERSRPALVAGMQPGAIYLDRRNLSVPRVALDGVGGWGIGLPAAGLDLDLGHRLDERGATVFFQQSARTLRQHTPTIAELGDARRARAEATVHVASRHADLVDALDTAGDRASLAALLEENRSSVAAVATAAAALGAVEVGAIDPIGDEWRALGADLVERTGALLRHLDTLWRAEGTTAGLDALGAESLRALAARQPEEIPGARGKRYLMVPQGDAEDGWLMALARYLTGCTGEDDTTLMLLGNIGPEGCSIDLLQSACSELTQRIEAPRRGGWAHVLLIDEQTRERPLYRLVAAADGWVSTGAAFDDEVREAAGPGAVPEVTGADLQDLGGGGLEPFPLQTVAPLRLLAWPDWTSPADLDALLDGFARPLLDRSDAALCLRFREGQDGAADAALLNLDEAFNRHFSDDDHFEVFLFDDGLDGEAVARVGVQADAVLQLPSSAGGLRAAFVAAVPVPPIDGPDAVAPTLAACAAGRPLPLVPAVTWTL